METTPIPINQPKVITSMMGSVFGTPMKGVELVPPSNPTTPVNTSVKPPLDVLTQEVATIKEELKQLRMELNLELEALRGQVKDLEKHPIVETGVLPVMDKTPNPLAPEKKKPGRPKKV